MSLFDPLVLPNGAVLPNRLAKAAMEESMSDHEHLPSQALNRLYRAWADGGAGLLLSGNVMIDRRALAGPGGGVLESDDGLDSFREWARIGRKMQARTLASLMHMSVRLQDSDPAPG